MYILNIYYVYLFMAKDNQVLIKLSDEEKEAFKRAAEINGVGFSAWARQRLRTAAVKELQEIGEKASFLNNGNQSQEK
jgi:hypothetical protein